MLKKDCSILTRLDGLGVPLHSQPNACQFLDENCPCVAEAGLVNYSK